MLQKNCCHSHGNSKYISFSHKLQKEVCHLIMKLKHQWTAQCSNSLCQWKSVFKNKLGASYSRSSASYFQFPLHCWDKSAVLFAFIFSSLFIKWLLVISISSILSSAVLNYKMKAKVTITLSLLGLSAVLKLWQRKQAGMQVLHTL